MSPLVTIYGSRIAIRGGDGAAVRYSVDIDLIQLDQLAIRAVNNKRRTAQAGPLIVRVASVTPAGSVGK